ncbi:hypothetical protein PDIDSM_8312 [Penicillium digitatum]|nr:hypothetical protein PDIDSM_8312 [Penicillium digitatum]
MRIASAWQRAFAKSDACSTGGTISSQSNADMLSSCDTFDGTFAISSSTSGVITINNVEEIEGALIADGASKLTNPFAPDLIRVWGAITLSNLKPLSIITMGALSQVS